MTQERSITRLFEFLAQSELRVIEKHEVCSTKFSVLRRSLRRIIILLREEGDEESGHLSERLRTLLSRWLTTPIEFDHNLLESIEGIGAGVGFETRWGAQIGMAYKAACGAARELAGTRNPLREKLKELVEGLVCREEVFRIYCHRSAVIDFPFIQYASVSTHPERELFLHTPREYRESNLFDVLIKVGPLRSRGWGAVPDAVLTAPRFNKLVQILWMGCNDELDFGYDPVCMSEVTDENIGSNPTRIICGMTWKTTNSRTGDDLSETSLGPEEDDFRILSELRYPMERRRCVLLHCGEQQGILYPPRADVLSFDPLADADRSIDVRSSVDGLIERMFVIEEHFHESEAGNAQAVEGAYSQIWKQHLVDRLLLEPDFESRLRKDGLDLRNLKQSLWHWSKSATTVVHAPQRRKHFEILIHNLNIDYSKYAFRSTNKTQWWQAAWNEVTKTRGMAIQTGLQEHRVADERLLDYLKKRLKEIQNEAKNNDVFYIDNPSIENLPGMLSFHKIVAIEEGFLAPDCNLRTIYDLEEIEQWRE